MGYIDCSYSVASTCNLCPLENLYLPRLHTFKAVADSVN
jgi:hypothetical protein